MSQIILCNQCKKEITTTHYVKCFSCNTNYHFSTCSPLSESTYLSMPKDRKMLWKCQNCKPRIRSQNTLHQAAISDDKNNKKQARTDDEEENVEIDQSKKFKDSESTTSSNSWMRNEFETFRSDLRDMQNTMNSFIANANNTLAIITQNVETLTNQVKDLYEKDKKRDDQMNLMEKRINKLEQQMICKNIEIKNITNTQISPYDVVKTIGTSTNVNINKEDINKAYRIKKTKQQNHSRVFNTWQKGGIHEKN